MTIDRLTIAQIPDEPAVLTAELLERAKKLMDTQRPSRCARCGAPFEDNSLATFYMGMMWHGRCFTREMKLAVNRLFGTDIPVE